MTIREAFAMGHWPTPTWILRLAADAGAYGEKAESEMRAAAEHLAKWRVRCADALLAALAEEKP